MHEFMAFQSGVFMWRARRSCLTATALLAVALPQTPLIAPALRGRLRGLAAIIVLYLNDKWVDFVRAPARPARVRVRVPCGWRR